MKKFISLICLALALNACVSEYDRIASLSYSASKMGVMVDVGYATPIDSASYTLHLDGVDYELYAVVVKEYGNIMYPSVSKGGNIRYYTLTLKED